MKIWKKCNFSKYFLNKERYGADFMRCIRNHRPHHSLQSTTNQLRYIWTRPCMVPLLSWRAQSICLYWLFHISNYFVHHGRSARICPWSYAFFHYSSHPLHILSVHMACCSSSTLTTLGSISPCPKLIRILQLPNSSFVSRPFIPGSAMAG